MDQVVMVILILVFAAVAIVIAIGNAKAARERQEELARWAAARGWGFDPQDTNVDTFDLFDVFTRGHSQRGYNTAASTLTIAGREFPAVAGDFLYKVTRRHGKGSSTTTYRFSYVLLQIPFPQVPDLLVRREGLFDKMAQALGFDDIDFESEEFSRKFCVKSSDRKFAYDVITPRMMEFLLAGGDSGIEIRGGWVCLTDGATQWMPEQFDGSLRFGEAFFGLWRAFVYQDLSGRGVESRP